MKIRKKTGYILLAVFLVALMFCLAGCKKDSKESGESDAEYVLYYMDQGEENIVPVEYEPQATTTEELVREIASVMFEVPEDSEYIAIAPDTVQVEGVHMTNGVVYLNVNDAYRSDMSVTREVLCRGAIANDILQIDGVEGLYILVDSLPLVDANGEEVPIMKKDSFIINPGKDINTFTESELEIYYASADGTGFVKEQRTIYYASNISPEKLVMEQLLEDPTSDDARSPLPENTGLINVSVLDGVCVVNLDDNFLNQDFGIDVDVVIYSIVNSLAELDSVDMVQIAVNGDTNITYRETYDLNQYFEPNYNLFTTEGAKVNINQQEGEVTVEGEQTEDTTENDAPQEGGSTADDAED